MKNFVLFIALLFVTPAHGTRHRPVGTARPADSAHPAQADAHPDAHADE
jgi:hypothetical protein